MTATDALERGRDAFSGQAWLGAFTHLTAADRETPLEVDDLERLAIAAYLTGRDEEGDDILARAHHDRHRLGDLARAARCAFWLGFGLMNRGETARASGWLTRAERLLDDHGQDCVERGYLLLPVALRALEDGDARTAHDIFGRATQIAERFDDLDLATLGREGQGDALIRLGEIERGVAMLDEAMLAVTSGEVSSAVVGIIYCSAVQTFFDILDLRRAHEWTTALTRWCESQPDLVPYRGSCLLYRAELMHLHGAWRDAEHVARRAHDELSRPPPQPAAGNALYLQAELHRVRGEFARAEGAYRQAGDWGRATEPGLAQLRLEQGRAHVATAAIRRAVDEATDRGTRARLLGPFVEIAVATGDLAAARAAADELRRIADHLRGLAPRAMADRADGTVLLAEGDARSALMVLRRAWVGWQGIDAPYEAARTRVLIGRACHAIGDEDAADVEFDGAARVFRELGAEPDMARLVALSGGRVRAGRTVGGLTPRELEVLRLVASGKTNRAIASDLVISEKTVARHISNIFTKLGLSSRSAATAYAYEHDLLSTPA